MPFSTTQANTSLDAAFTGTLYLALSNGNPTATGAGGTEITGSGYARQVMSFAAASGGHKSINADITFSVPEGDITHYKIMDALTGGNMVDYGELNSGNTVDVSIDSSSLLFESGNLTIELSTS